MPPYNPPKLRIWTEGLPGALPGDPPRGKNLKAVVVQPDGTETPLPPIWTMSIVCLGRKGLVSATLSFSNVELDVEAVEAGEPRKLDAFNEDG